MAILEAVLAAIGGIAIIVGIACGIEKIVITCGSVDDLERGADRLRERLVVAETRINRIESTLNDKAEEDDDVKTD